MISRIYAIFLKEIKSEFRLRSSISAVALFIVVTVTIVAFACQGEVLSKAVSGGLLWIIMFFSAMTGLAKIFISEEERGTGFLLQLSAKSDAVFFGKLAYNSLLSLSINLFSIAFFFLLINPVKVGSVTSLLLVSSISSLGLASAATIISALLAKAGTKNALFPVLAFPIVLPLLLSGINATQKAFDGAAPDAILADITTLTAYVIVVSTVSFLLFDFVWRE